MKENDIENLFEEANNYFINKDFEKAEKKFLEIVKLQPKHYPSYERLSNIALSRNNIKEAIEYLKKYLKYNPHNPDVWNNLGNLYFEILDYNNSIKCYKKTIWLDKEAYWAYYNIGLSLSEMGNKNSNMEKAKSWFKKAIKINPEYSPALNEIGIYYQNKYDYVRAKDYFNRAIKYNPNYKYPFFNLAKLYKVNNQIDKAKNALIRAIKIDPQYTAALNYLGILYYEEENYNEALYYYSKAIKTDPEYKFSYYNMSLIFSATGKYRKAMDLLKMALELDEKYQLALQEKERLEKNYKDQILNGEPLTENDLNPEFYKDYVVEGIIINDEPQVNLENNKKEKYSEKFGRNITKLAKEGKLYEILGRDKEIDSVLETLFLTRKNNPLLVGKAGVGKTSIVEGLALRIARGDVPEYFKSKEIIEINMGILVAGTTFRGDFEKRLKTIIEEVSKDKDIILFIDEIHTILGAGESAGSNLDAANILKPALAKGELRCIGATTTDEYLKIFQKDSALDRRFYKIQIEELGEVETLEILRSLKSKLENHFHVSVDESILELIVQLSKEELKNRVFPDKAIDIFEKSMSKAALHNQPVLTVDIVKNVIAEIIGYNIFATEAEREKHLLGMEDYLNKICIGQKDAIKKVTQAIITSKSKITLSPNRPDGVLLFVGPSGVGKTYLAKEIAKYMYNSYDKCLVINMSEYSEPHSVSKLIGSPPGYVGHENVPILTQFIQSNPSSILLLDDIDKANYEVLKLFLRIFDEGVITDTTGKTIYFSNVTIIMTTNVVNGNAVIGFENNKEIDYSSKLKDFFQKDFLNRVDQIIQFNYLTKDDARTIVEKLLLPKAKSLLMRRNINLTINDSLIEEIIQKGFDKVKGVRNLEKEFERKLLNFVYQR